MSSRETLANVCDENSRSKEVQFVKLNLKNVVNLTEQFLKNSTTNDCIYLSKAISSNISDNLLPSDKEEDDFSSYLEIHQHEKTNLFEYTKFYEDRDLIFSELSHKFQITLKYGFPTFSKSSI